MKAARRFTALFLLLLLLLLFHEDAFIDRHGEVNAFRGAQLKADVFDPLIAGNVNQAGLLRLTIDGKEEALDTGELFLNQNMHVMASLEFIRNVFSCAANLYDDSRIEILRNSHTFILNLKAQDALQDGEEVKLIEAPQKYSDKTYICLEDFCSLINYDFRYDAEKTTVVLDSSDAETPKLRGDYDLRDHGRVSKIRDQGSLSACWSYAAMSALESSMLPERSITLSPDNLAEHNTYGISAEDSGTYMVAMSSMLAWKQPIEENGSEVALHLQEVHYYSGDDKDAVKWAIFKNGGVSTSLYAEIDTSNLSKSSFYNNKNNSYYYDGNKEPNHDVVIIGWDDDYPKTRFSRQAKEDGAFICQNSWGSEFGDKGVFYVSYDDTNIAKSAVSYVKVESTTNYDHIYQSDLEGHVGNLGYNTPTALAANVYTARGDEELRAVGLYAVGPETEYRIYTVSDFTDTTSLSRRREQASGTLQDAGFYTIPLRDALPLTQGENFAVVIMLTTKNGTLPIAVEYPNSKLSEQADITDGKGYISRNGLNWSSVEDTYAANLCLKAYTTNKNNQNTNTENE